MVRKGIGNRAGERKELSRRVALMERQIKLAMNFSTYARFLKKARKYFDAARGDGAAGYRGCSPLSEILRQMPVVL